MTQGHRTARNVIVVSAASFIQIVVQFLFQRVIAGSYGAQVEADALAAALAIPTMFAAVVTGSLSYVLVPELVSKFAATPKNALGSLTREQRSDDHAAWRLASFVGLVTCCVSICISLLLYASADIVCGWLYGDLTSSKLQLTSDLLRILSVQVVLGGIISWTQAVHHSRHRFLIPALAGVLGTGISLALAYRYGGSEITSIAWAINIGSIISGLIQLLVLLPHLRSPRADLPALLRLCGLFWPLLLGASLMRVDPLIDRVLAAKLASVDPGAIAYVNYAQRILAALLAIGTSGLAVVAFPQLAQRFEGAGEQGFAQHFALAFRRLILLVVPITFGFSLFSVWIIRDLLQNGEFTSHDSTMVGWLIVGFMGMFVGASCADLLARGYYALGDTKTPTWIGSSALLISWVVKVWLFSIVGIWGIAWGVSFYCLLSAAGMGWCMTRRFKWDLWTDCAVWGWQALASTAVACGCCYAIYLLLQPVLPGTLVAAPVGAIVYFIGLLTFGNDDAKQLGSAIRGRLLG